MSGSTKPGLFYAVLLETTNPFKICFQATISQLGSIGALGSKWDTGKIPVWGPGGLGAFFTVNWKLSIAQKLRRIILLHLGLVTSRFHYWKTLNPLIFMIWGFSDVSMSSKTNYFYLWRHQDTFKNPRTSEFVYENIIYISISISEINLLGNVGKDGHRQIMKICLIFQNVEYEIIILQKSMSMFLEILNKGSRSSKNHRMGIW